MEVRVLFGAYGKGPLQAGFFFLRMCSVPTEWDRAENAVENGGRSCQSSARRRSRREIAALQAELDEQTTAASTRTRRRAAGSSSCARRGATRTTTRRRAPDGSQLRTREQALVAKGQWEAQMAGGAVAIGRERFETLLAALPAPRQGRDDPAARGRTCAPTARKRLLPYFSGMQMSKIIGARWCATGARRCSSPSRRASGRRRRSTTLGSRCSGAAGWPSRTA